MAKIPYNVDAYTARLIGRENVSKLDGAVLELVKNTYDADASVCLVYYEETTNRLFLADNGSGMDAKTIQDHWMTIGSSSKVKSYHSRKGRVQTGAKGIGRFALDRIADSCQMLTKSAEGTLLWTTNWEDFQPGNPLTSVYADLSPSELTFTDFFADVNNREIQKVLDKHFLEHGTVFCLNNLRDTWNQTVLQSLRTSLSTLIPIEYKQEFNILFFDEETVLENSEVLTDSSTFDYDYRVQFDVADDIVDIIISRKEFDFGGEFQKITTGAGFSPEDIRGFKEDIKYQKNFSDLFPSRKKNNHVRNTIGDFSGALYFVKLTAPKKEKERLYYRNFEARKDYRNTFGGVKIYRDRFRVRPYGDFNSSAYDWLLLANRKMKSAAAVTDSRNGWRVNADQIMGAIYISRTNLTLPDQANREGIVETPEFRLLKQFIINVLKLLEDDRMRICQALDTYYEQAHPVESYEEEIERKSSSSKRDNQNAGTSSKESKEEPEDSSYVKADKAQAVIDKKNQQIEELENEISLLQALATTGILTNEYVHEIKDSTHKVFLYTVSAKEELELDQDPVSALEDINKVVDLRTVFDCWFKVTIGSVRRDKRTMQNVNLRPLINQLKTNWHETFARKQIDFDLTQVEDITFRCFPYEVESIINNLITNSMAIFDANHVDSPQIKIAVTQTPPQDGIIIHYSDNGPGLLGNYKELPELILKPFESSKTDEDGNIIGTGMGMWIINRISANYGGNVDVSQNKVVQQGFFADITLKGRLRGAE